MSTSMAGDGESPLPGLDAARIEAFADHWEDQGLWEDVQIIARRLWAAEDEVERAWVWHHLVMAVGNFKRDGGRRLHPVRLAANDSAPDVAAGDTLIVPGSRTALAAERPDSWSELKRVLPGAGTATTTTLLAALWPSRHFVFDRRVHAVANALRMCAGLSTSVVIDPRSTGTITESMQAYGDVRAWLLRTSEMTGQALFAVERALYELSRSVDRPRGTRPRTWKAFAQIVEERVLSA